MRLFGRTAQVILERTTPQLPIQIGSPNESLHIEFTATKTTLGQPDTLDLLIYNLADKTRASLQGAGSYVFFRAGYVEDKANLPVVFQGDIRTIDQVRRGPDWITRVQCGDGEIPYQFAQAGKSFRAGTPVSDVASYLAQQIKGVSPGKVSIASFLTGLDDIVPPVQTFAGGFSVEGNAFAQLQSILGSSIQVVIQDGELRMLKATESRKEVVQLDGAHGMIESPEHGSPNPGGLVSVLKVSTLLRADIRPGDVISIKTEGTTNDGTFRVQKLVHRGDLAGNDWRTDLECLPFGFQQPVSR
jgi:hypothetical protein